MTTENKKARILEGVVVSDKMDKTIIVSVSRLIKHPKYGKYFSRSKRYKADDPDNKFKVGDQVRIEECRPLAKDKSFKVIV